MKGALADVDRLARRDVTVHAVDVEPQPALDDGEPLVLLGVTVIRRLRGALWIARLLDVPEDLDRISVYLPPQTTFAVLPDIAEKGAREVWFNPGAADARVLEEARRREIPVRNGCSSSSSSTATCAR